jgi:tyrosine-protein phosphatase YwqE
MKVNFNNVRKQALYRYDDLVNKLNHAILKKENQYAIPNDVYHGQEINIKGYVLIDAEELDEVLNDLRMLLGTIASCHEEGNDEVRDIFFEVYPEGTDKKMALFNQEEDD